MTNEQLVLRIRGGEDVPGNMCALYEQNSGMIAKIAGKYKSYAEFEDLMQEGYIGLCSAVDAWKPDGGACFVNYAVYWIKQAMQRYIENNGSCMRIPVGQQNRIRKYKKIKGQYLKMLGREPEMWELCRLLGVSQRELHQIQEDAKKGQIQSLSAPLGEDGDLTLADTIADQRDEYAGVLDTVQQEELKEAFRPILASLKEIQAQVLKCRYMDRKTLKETGELVGCSLNRAQQIEGEAIKELRRPKYSRQLRPFLYDDTVRSRGMQGTGVKQFEQTWTSATEREALRC